MHIRGQRYCSGIVAHRFNASRDLPVPSNDRLSNSWLPGITFERIDYSVIIALMPKG
jgi:hypothetical protein